MNRIFYVTVERSISTWFWYNRGFLVFWGLHHTHSFLPFFIFSWSSSLNTFDAIPTLSFPMNLLYQYQIVGVGGGGSLLDSVWKFLGTRFLTMKQTPQKYYYCSRLLFPWNCKGNLWTPDSEMLSEQKFQTWNSLGFAFANAGINLCKWEI